MPFLTLLLAVATARATAVAAAAPPQMGTSDSIYELPIEELRGREQWRSAPKNPNHVVLALVDMGGRVPAACTGQKRWETRTFTLPVANAAALGARTTRVTLAWSAARSGWSTAAVRIDADGETRLASLTPGRSAIAGSRLSVDIPASLVREMDPTHGHGLLTIQIGAGGRCLGRKAASWVLVDQMEIEVLP